MEKGWIQGVMFQALFTDDLYFQMARHANEMAARLQDGLKAKGWTLWVESPTNQVFATVPNDVKPQIDAVCDYEDWCPYDETHTVVRFVTCFHTSLSFFNSPRPTPRGIFLPNFVTRPSPLRIY